MTCTFQQGTVGRMNNAAMEMLKPLLPSPDPANPINTGIPQLLELTIHCMDANNHYGDERFGVALSVRDLTNAINARSALLATAMQQPTYQPVSEQQVSDAVAAGMQEVLAKRQTQPASVVR